MRTQDMKRIKSKEEVKITLILIKESTEQLKIKMEVRLKKLENH